MQLNSPLRNPAWTSQRRLFEQKLSDLHKCSNLNHLKQVHAQIFKAGLHDDPFVAPKLITAFSLCRRVELAVNAFNIVQEANVLLYNTLIRAQVQNSQPSQAFSTFLEMRGIGMEPDNFTYPFLLKACSAKPSLRTVEMIHNHIEKFGFCSDVFVPNSLIDTYSKCGPVGVSAAKKLFMAMPERDIVSWNSMIGGLVKAGELAEARRLFDETPERDRVSWNTMLDGYAKAGEMDAAFILFEKMPERDVISWSTMVSGYSKAGDMDMARMLFNKMPFKNLIPWTIMVSGYAEKGFAKEAISLYKQMEETGLKPDDGAVIGILAACAKSGLLGLGTRVYASIQRTGFSCSIQMSNALIDMYAKCGSLNKASKVFDDMAKRDLVSWNVMLHGLAMHGHGEEALKLFSRMKLEGFKPDKITFVGVLSACTHAGYVDDGLLYFQTMERDYGIVPQIEHYGCMIDLLGHWGRLEEAFKLVKSMPFEPNAIIWGTLLGACRMHNAVELAEDALHRLVELEPSDAGNFSMLSNIYAAAGDWNNVANVRMQMKSKGIQKPSGASSIELDNEVHEFTVFDMSHPKSDKIYQIIDRLVQDLKEVDYVSK
ncbi:pentatricopeptide repeat-containing protein At3g29230 [Malania oleifera]|uniref:pentatricopeptide repeat-containing protein At3g29230 n=1 Tax=Malania oleifera TaxID=397392 RepID=UPI0025AE757F|nr:pentatricopeptide repeat-containing protein At3g29230 [Malania oleifera]